MLQKFAVVLADDVGRIEGQMKFANTRAEATVLARGMAQRGRTAYIYALAARVEATVSFREIEEPAAPLSPPIP